MQDAQFPPQLPPENAMHDLEPHEYVKIKAHQKKAEKAAQEALQKAASTPPATPKKVAAAAAAASPSPTAAKVTAKAAGVLPQSPAPGSPQSLPATPQSLVLRSATPQSLTPPATPAPKPKPLTEADVTRLLQEAITNKSGKLPAEIQKIGPTLTGTLVLPKELKLSLAALQFITKTFPNLSGIDLSQTIELTQDGKLDPKKPELIEMLYFLTCQPKLSSITLSAKVSLDRGIGVDLVEELAGMTGDAPIVDLIYKRAAENMINVFSPGETRFGAGVKEYASADSEKIRFLTARLLTGLQTLKLTSGALPDGFLKTLLTTPLPYTLKKLDLTLAKLSIEELRPLLSFQKLTTLVLSDTHTIEGHANIRNYLQSELAKRTQTDGAPKLPTGYYLPKNFGGAAASQATPPPQPQLKAAAAPLEGPSPFEIAEKPIVAALRETLKTKRKLSEEQLNQFDTFMVYFYKHPRTSDNGATALLEVIPDQARQILATKTIEEEKKFFRNLSMIIHPDKNVRADAATLAFYTLLSKYLAHYHGLANTGDKTLSPPTTP